ncbi:transposase [Rhodobacter sp. NSM]|uniref:transposase n=1 Tax=Rhodobacter sp. NSM TaxID=3457501 RepID=UPI003FD0E2F1
MQSVPGVSTIVAATLLAESPEIGTKGLRRIAALAGLTPTARDSGQRNGKRVIGGGWATVRTPSISPHCAHHSFGDVQNVPKEAAGCRKTGEKPL